MTHQAPQIPEAGHTADQPEKTRVVVTVSGGVVQATVASRDDVEIIVIDYDIQGVPMNEPHNYCVDRQGEVFVPSFGPNHINPQDVDDIWQRTSKFGR